MRRCDDPACLVCTTAQRGFEQPTFRHRPSDDGKPQSNPERDGTPTLAGIRL
jgi:hypothetical protein